MPSKAPAGSPPQSVPNYFATTSGLDKKAETAVVSFLLIGTLELFGPELTSMRVQWSVDIVSGAVSAQWINTDGSKSLQPAESFAFSVLLFCYGLLMWSRSFVII